MKIALALAALLTAAPAFAQVVPRPGLDNPRLQSVRWIGGQEVLLTALPRTGLTVVLEPGEQIQRVVLDREHSFEVQVSAEGDELLVLPLVDEATGAMRVSTDRRDYSFQLRTGTGLMAAYLVRLQYGAAAPTTGSPVAALELTTGETWNYRLKGDRSVRPDRVTDDGVRTRIEFAPSRALPGIFAIGPTGEEQVVNGYMRDGVFVIDRVWDELVFRIDKDKATARRDRRRERADG